MKKLFLSMLAAVTLFASCSQEDVAPQQSNGEESLVSFTLTIPQLGSRATDATFDGDGSQATDLYYAVYDETIGEIVEPISIKGTESDAITVGTSKEIKLPLLNGHKYSLIFWAKNEACPFSVNWEEKTIALDATTLQSNKEVYDAFYAYVEPFVVTGHKTETVTLKRPFAQLNIATSAGDLERVVEYYGLEEITETQIVVTTPTTMDLTTGKAYDEKELTYFMGAFSELNPESDLFGETVKPEIDGVYTAISLNYLLVSAEKQLVDVKMSCNSGDELDKEFKNVPAQRNYRTNIYGNLYTSQSVWNVVIEPEFGGNLEAADQLAAVFEKGGEVTLYTDVELTEPLVLKEGKEVTINLNGQTIDAVGGGKDAFIVNDGTLNIYGDGEIKTADKSDAYTVIIDGNNAEVNIYGGTYSIGLDDTATKTGTGVCNSAVYTKNSGKANIYGGKFQVVTSQTAEEDVNVAHYLLNRKDQSSNEAGGEIKVYGGTFCKFNPGDNLAEGQNTSYLVDGYSSVQVGENYIVIEGTAVTDAEELTHAFTNTTNDVTISLINDILLEESLTLNCSDKIVTINLNGKKINAVGDKDAFIVNNGTLNIKGDGEVKTADKSEAYTVIIDGNNAEVNIYGGTYSIGLDDTATKTGTGVCNTAVYTKNQGKANIYGGKFQVVTSQTADEGVNVAHFLLNRKDQSSNEAGGEIKVYGGTFVKFNPANNLAEGQNTNYVVDGYTSKQEGDWYTVVKE